jgi:hypothetical protein
MVSLVSFCGVSDIGGGRDYEVNMNPQEFLKKISRNLFWGFQPSCINDIPTRLLVKTHIA